MARKKKILDPIICEVCGIEFTPADKRRRTCSRSCGGRLGNTKASREKAKKTKMERYGDPNYNNREGMKKNLQKKYGEDIINTSQLPHVKEKIKKTYTERHGGMGMASKSVADKVLQSVKEQHGIDDDSITNVGQIDAVKDRIRETHEERWGGIGFASEELFERSNETFKDKYGQDIYGSKREEMRAEAFIEKYGVKSPAQVPEFREKLIENYIAKHGGMGNARDSVYNELEYNLKLFDELYNENSNIVELAEEFNRSVGTLRNWGEKLGYNIKVPNHLNETWALYLEKETGVKFDFEGYIYGNQWRADLYNEDLRLAIEINPTVTHTTQPSIFHGKKVPVKYHQERSIRAEENGWNLIQVFDWDNKEDIAKLVKSYAGKNKVIYARNCEVREVSRPHAQLFVKNNHRQGSVRSERIAFGLFYEEELVQIMTFSGVRFTKMNENSYELIRMCSLDGYTIVGGASKLFAHFVNSDYQPEYIKSFVDYSKGQGKTYEHMGMTYAGLANLNALYANIDTGEAMKVTQVSKKYKKEYDKLGLTQQEFMNKKRFYRINDAGNKIYEWRKK